MASPQVCANLTPFHSSPTPHRESRHPNVVLYLGLSRAPEPDGRIFIISEFIENGRRLFCSRYPYPVLYSSQATFANTSTTNPSRFRGVSDSPLLPTSLVRSPTFMHANASTATSKARTYSSPRMVASRSQTLGLRASPLAPRKSPVASPFAAQMHTCPPRSSSATSLISRSTFSPSASFWPKSRLAIPLTTRHSPSARPPLPLMLKKCASVRIRVVRLSSLSSRSSAFPRTLLSGRLHELSWTVSALSR